MTSHTMIATGVLTTGSDRCHPLGISMKITSGIRAAAGRRVEVLLDAEDLASVLSSLATSHPGVLQAAAAAVTAGLERFGPVPADRYDPHWHTRMTSVREAVVRALKGGEPDE